MDMRQINMKKHPLVSVIMPVYNAQNYIVEAVDSILNQTYKNIELITIVDAPTDLTQKVLEKYTDSRIVKVINDINCGISYATNQGLNLAKGKFIAFMDDDDICPLDRIEIEVDFLEQHIEYDVVGGAHCQMDSNGNPITFPIEQKNNPKYIKAYYLFGEVGIYNGTMMIRKQFLQKNKIRCRENCFGMQDLQFYMECSKFGNITTLKKLMLYHRIHDTNACEIGMKKFSEKRKEAYARFQRQSLEMSGYMLDESEMSFLNRVLSEYKEDYCKSIDELITLRDIFKKILFQGKKMGIDYYDELESVCRDLLAKQVRKMPILSQDWK